MKSGWSSGLRRYVQVVVYSVGVGSNPTPDTTFRVFLYWTIAITVKVGLEWRMSIRDVRIAERSNAAFRLACHSPHCRFDGDFCTTAQAPLATEGRPISGKQRLANKSITPPLCPRRQTADSWILFNSGAMPFGDKAKAACPLRAVTLKQQAMIMRRSGKAASGKLVWNQH